MEEGKFIIKISDDGDGFEEIANERGNGLNNMQARLEEIGGEMIVNGNTGKGTLIKVELPYPFKIPEIRDRHNKSL